MQISVPRDRDASFEPKIVAKRQKRLSGVDDQIAAIIAALGDVLAVLRSARPADKAEIYSQLRPRLTNQPGQRIIHAEARLDSSAQRDFDGVRGATQPITPCVLNGEFVLGQSG